MQTTAISYSTYYERYLQPIGNAVCKATIEVVKVVAAKYLLEFLVLAMFNGVNGHRLAFSIVRMNVVTAPVKEEILFRGLIQGGLYLTDKCWSMFIAKQDLSEKDRLLHQRIRVHATAILFGLAHVSREASWDSNLMRLGWNYIAGLNYGYLSEKYQTISLGILAHGCNNSIGQLADLQRITNVVAIPCAIIQQVALAIISWR